MKHILIIFFSLIQSFNCISQPGTLDSSFGNNGIVIGESFTGNSVGSVLQKDGKIVATGSNYSEPGGFITVRYNSDGSPDNSFGNNGIVVTPVNSSPEAMGLQSNGKIILTGTTSSSNSNIILVRYNEDGSPDSSFGVDGTLIVDFTTHDRVIDMAIQPDDKIIIIGRTDNGENDPATMVMARYLSDGTRDKSFGDEGKEFIEYLHQLVYIDCITLQPDGKILIGAANEGPPKIYFFVERYLINGQKDSTFGIDGRASYYFNTNTTLWSTLTDLAVYPNGKIIATGQIQSSQNFKDNIALVRFDNNGTVDSSFNKNGAVVTTFNQDTASEANTVLIQPDGKIIDAGRIYNSVTQQGSNFIIIRYTTDGSLDSAFGNNGLQTTSIGSSDDVSGALLQIDGKIILTGNSNIGGNQGVSHFVFARYLGDPQEKYVHIKKWLHHHGITWDDCPAWLCNNLNYYKVERSTNGNSFSEIARIFKHNNQQQYSFEDAAPLSSISYYRLSAVSTNGSVVNSNVLVTDGINTSIKLYPNPVNNNLYIEGLSATQTTKLTIIDFAGNIKASAAITGSAYNWNIAQLKSGNYLLRIETTGNVVLSKKFIKE